MKTTYYALVERKDGAEYPYFVKLQGEKIKDAVQYINDTLANDHNIISIFDITDLLMFQTQLNELLNK